ncbi:PR-1-like protein [Daldinia caldariorum]|uniref:PR-1-like protein n=1 Tax=Daldinia caldariorum TaxID=326644 RepID=UPI002008E209|nr:PR-1-like protein [Daldinia caldariorum]KAI1464329.1 PR-1-like protein [Daldinia caldariorum]
MFIYPHLSISLLSLPATLLSSLFLFAPLASSSSSSTTQTVVRTVTVTVPPPIPSDAPSFTDHVAFTYAILNSTNFHRAAHNASAVRWNATLADFATDYLSLHSSPSPSSQKETETKKEEDNGKETCVMKHSGGPYGENLALGCADAGACVDLWARESGRYDFDYPGFAEETGHFTQLVWRGTTDVGCGARLCPGNYGWYLACEYWPRGNVVGAFREEVRRESGAAAAGGGRGGQKGKGKGEWVVVVGAAVVAWWGLV